MPKSLTLVVLAAVRHMIATTVESINIITWWFTSCLFLIVKMCGCFHYHCCMFFVTPLVVILVLDIVIVLVLVLVLVRVVSWCSYCCRCCSC